MPQLAETLGADTSDQRDLPQHQPRRGIDDGRCCARKHAWGEEARLRHPRRIPTRRLPSGTCNSASSNGSPRPASYLRSTSPKRHYPNFTHMSWRSYPASTGRRSGPRPDRTLNRDIARSQERHRGSGNTADSATSSISPYANSSTPSTSTPTGRELQFASLPSTRRSSLRVTAVFPAREDFLPMPVSR